MSAIREIRRLKLYEALDYLEQTVEPTWLVKRYRRQLSGDRRNERDKEQLREALRIATRGIQQVCAALLVDKLNELAVRFRKNKAEIVGCVTSWQAPLSYCRSRPGCDHRDKYLGFV